MDSLAGLGDKARREINRRQKMVQFNIDSHLSNGKRLEWLALADAGELPEAVLQQVKQAAVGKFGEIVSSKRWGHAEKSNGYVVVIMEA
ncbi:hypothetical protein ACTAB0_11650 [Pseudomonas syringae]|uniref:hypothetical protein n=1 Tax=Pseudomonas syringae TaxID=317 RepID=UPI003F799F11